ncbi:hypothetical protein [Legionella cincinnatiensis]|uniref:HAD-superfamily phosphatase n=1 Tax=Legionella cincinnatiensis TaxID=28085 RepID=A0A378INH8_9GAMM|nr:hypothetical protein [Legionella cincinnatiensis]KTC85274.1 HAD-superfamily phosphatase [Legionella cincinnatiensis]STX36362.1 HAD-superfamily phosphatase [Legionella cincinnatiensis]
MNEIKLIIWDLDDTLWKGTLADQDDVILNQDVIARIEYLLNRGIVHSICSKNDVRKAEKMLKQLGIYEFFIFPKISFEDKGLRIKKIIEQAQLREQNVLFVDDNEFVLREVLFHNPNIAVKLADQFMQEDVSNWGKNDSNRERLAHYKILERKEKNKITFLEKNNDEHAFLKECNIKIQLIPLDINDHEIERVIELVNRSNQMNYTRSRIKYEYLFTLFELKNGSNFKIRVEDKYGDYGVVGYVCILNNTLFHYVFSCRILGMCVEARMYQWLKAMYPELKPSFNISKLKNVDINLDFIAINLQQESDEKKSTPNSKKVLVRGPCLANAVSFLLSEHYHVDEEIFSFFEYANLHFLRENLEGKQDTRFDKTRKAIESNEYHMIVNFLESDYYSGNYKIQSKKIPVTSSYIFWKSLKTIKQDNQVLGEHIKTMMINGMRDIKRFNLDNRFSPWPRIEKIVNATLDWFGDRWRKILYQFIFYFVFKNYRGYVSEKQFENNVLWYIGLFPEHVKLLFINPPEKIPLPLMTQEQNERIVKRTELLNKIMRNIAKEKPNVLLLEMDDILDQEDIVDSFSHLKRKGYIKLSQLLLKTAKCSFAGN